MNTRKYLWSILFLFVIGGQSFAQEEVIELQETIKHIPQNKEHLLELVEAAENKNQYTHCGDFYRWAEYEKNEKKRKRLDKQAIKFYKKAIKNGEVEAYHAMAYMYHTGKGSNIRDYVESSKYLEIAANKGHLPALYNLGVLYMYTGKELVEKDVDKAESIFINIAKGYSKDIHPPSTQLPNNSLQKRSIQYLIDLYSNPNISPKGKKLNLKKAVEWSNVINDHSILERLYDKLSDYESLKKWIRMYPSFTPYLRLSFDLSKIESVNATIEQIRFHLNMIGVKRLYKLEKTVFNEFFNSDSNIVTHQQTLNFLQGVRKYIIPKRPVDYATETKFFEKIKAIENVFAQQYKPENIFMYLQQIHERAISYPEIVNSEYQALQKIALSPIEIQTFSEKNIKSILLVIAQKSWKKSEYSTQILIKGEQVLCNATNNNPAQTYFQDLQTRWEKYTKKNQQLCFNITLRHVLEQSQTTQRIKPPKDLRFLSVAPYSILQNAKKLQEEILGLRDVAQKLKLTYDFIRLEKTLVRAQTTISFEAYQKNYTNKTDLNCQADEQGYQMKKVYYQSLLKRIRIDKGFQENHKDISSFWKLLLSEERIGVSYDGDRHSFKNLWIFLQEFVLQLTADEYKIWLQQLDPESKKLLCRAVQNSGKIRFHALVKENAQYSLKWHIAHTSPNCIPTWSQEIKDQCSFCFFPTDRYSSEKEFDSYSPLAYAEKEVGDESLVQLLKSLGAQKDKRDQARREREKIQKEKDQKTQVIEEEKQKQHSNFLATLKVGDCVSGYIYFDCKPPFFSKEYFRLKVSGRLISVTQNEYRECFIKITTLKKIERRSSGKWIETSGFGACDETQWHFLDRESPIEKRDILSLCY